MDVNSLMAELAAIGRDPSSGGYHRLAWTPADLQCREWFAATAQSLGLDVDVDRNGNAWAWWGEPGPDALVLGSHLDSVSDGGAYDGPLGVASAFAAVAAAQAAGVVPSRPVAVVDFADEEGARFGVACIGSRLMSGSMAPETALALADDQGTTLADALRHVGRDPASLGRDREALGRVGLFVELHVEQGRALADLGAPVAIASTLWPHGRWRLEVDGEANHAGTTALADRHDAMLAVAELVVAARVCAAETGALATVGRLDVEPGSTNAIPSRVRAWLDARAPDSEALERMLTSFDGVMLAVAGRHGVRSSMTAESVSPAVEFSASAVSHLERVLGPLPRLSSGAGHDAGVLTPHVPTAMLFVRNPTGVSHSPSEHAEPDDCAAGQRALAALVQDWQHARREVT